MNFINVIPNIVKGFEIKRGTMVLLNFWGEDTELEILNRFAIEIGKAGGVPIKWQQSREFMKNYFCEVSAENLEFPDKYYEIFKLADAVVDIFMYSPAPHKDFSKDKLPLYGAHMRKLFGALTSGSQPGTGMDKDLFVQVRIPTVENAMEDGIDFETYEAALYKALDIDILQLKENCKELVSKLEGKNKVIVHTSGNRELSFELKDRNWHKDDGTGDVPWGEVYISPIEESANGEIEIPLIILEGARYEEVVLIFKAGKLVECSSKEIHEFIKSFPGDSDIFAEFGIGMNENIKELIGCQVIDEKCNGTAHIAVGMNNLAGGKNESPFHMDFIFKPEKIEMDQEVIWEGAKML
jgi:aminopeptidase